MLSKLKGYALAALSVLAAVLAALWQHSKASHAKDKLAGEKAARETENKANKAMVEGLNDENKIQNDNTVDRSKFLD